MSSRGDSRGRLAEEAAAWFLKLNDPACTEAEQRSFDAWLAADVSHREEYRQFERLWKTLDSIPPKRARRVRRAALAGFALLGILALMLRFAPPTEQRLIATGIGERRHFVLGDGTELDVNAGSRLRTHYSWFSRSIEVESGEALFTVAPERMRPFEVHAGNGRMRDIGTTFDVANEGGRITVGVIEGEVKVTLDGRSGGAMLGGGRQLSFGAAGVMQVAPLDAEAATAWREGRWIFKDTPLAEVVARMNRQHQRQTMLTDPELARLHVSGAFDIDDRDGLLVALQALYQLRVSEEGETTRLARR